MITSSCTVTGSWQTTIQNTFCNLVMNSYVLGLQGIHNALWYRMEDTPLHQDTVAIFASGDDFIALGDFSMSVAASKEAFTRLGQVQKFCKVNGMAYSQFLSMSFIELNGELIILKDIDKLLSHSQYTGNNRLFLKYPVLYHTIFYNLVKGMRLSHALEDLLHYRLLAL